MATLYFKLTEFFLDCSYEYFDYTKQNSSNL